MSFIIDLRCLARWGFLCNAFFSFLVESFLACGVVYWLTLPCKDAHGLGQLVLVPWITFLLTPSSLEFAKAKLMMFFEFRKKTRIQRSFYLVKARQAVLCSLFPGFARSLIVILASWCTCTFPCLSTKTTTTETPLLWPSNTHSTNKKNKMDETSPTCNQCSTALPVNAKYCPECGQPIISSSHSQPSCAAPSPPTTASKQGTPSPRLRKSN